MSKSQTKGFDCPGCAAHRVHELVTIRTGDKKRKVTRAWQCTACGLIAHRNEAANRPGIHCPKCSDVRLQVVSTRHKDGATNRKRRCLYCGHSIHTVERVVSYG